MKFLPEKFRFPGPRDRVTLNGMTGSGKSTFAIWLFGESADYHLKPWIFIDYKNEDIIEKGLKRKLFELQSVYKNPPRKPGIFVVRHNVRDGQAPMTDFLWKIYEQGNVGIFLDEATMIPELRGEANSGGPFQSILSQGRSKGIPVYTLAQRPVHVNKMVYSEANFRGVFRLMSKDDLKKVLDHIPDDSNRFEEIWGARRGKLEKYHSRWYDGERDENFLVSPSPSGDQSLDIIEERKELSQRHKVI